MTHSLPARRPGYRQAGRLRVSFGPVPQAAGGMDLPTGLPQGRLQQTRNRQPATG